MRSNGALPLALVGAPSFLPAPIVWTGSPLSASELRPRPLHNTVGVISPWRRQQPYHHHHPARRRWLPSSSSLCLTNDPFSNSRQQNDDDDDDSDEEVFLRRELERLESLEELVAELEQDDLMVDDDDDDEEVLDELFGTLPDDADPDELAEMERYLLGVKDSNEVVPAKSAESLERALLQGVVPADAGVGSGCLPGDFGFDPLGLSTRDVMNRIHVTVLHWLPQRQEENDDFNTLPSEWRPRPTALILRDYREAEIRHSRLAMLAAVFWPLQEMLDRLLLDDFGPLLNNMRGGVTMSTLPYIPLLMTAIMLLLGYLDIYSKAIKDVEDLGEAFLPGDCFWDPLSILQGAPDRMKRNMQERELFNGRMAMLAIAVYVFEEITTGLPLISIPSNDLLFEPAYQVPFIQQWLDSLFQSPSASLPAGIDFVERMKQVMQEEDLLN